MISSYKELIVWKKSFDLSFLVYKATKNFPKEETYGIVSQIRRSAVSIPSNIAEGYGRRRRTEFLQFLHIAYGSGSELETQLLLSNKLGYLPEKEFDETMALLTEVMKMLNALIVKIKG